MNSKFVHRPVNVLIIWKYRLFDEFSYDHLKAQHWKKKYFLNLLRVIISIQNKSFLSLR